MLSQQEISDRFEIQDMVFHYADCIDRRDFDALKDVFTDDAHIDYTAVGGPQGSRDEIIDFLKKALTAFKTYQHLNANVQIKVNGDTATGRVMCFNPSDLKLGKGKTHLFMIGIWYNDTYVRTPDGWRIKTRAEEKSWAFNLPDFMTLGTAD
jgi:ketosteroid isomerase-like protein